MKTILALLALAAAVGANAQPNVVAIYGPFADPPFGSYVLVIGDQMAGNSVTFESASTPAFTDARVAAFYDCSAVRQNVVAVFPYGPPWTHTFFRARNDPCVPAPAAWRAPDPAAWLDNPFGL